MASREDAPRLSKEQLEAAIRGESKKFQEIYSWVEAHMPPRFFTEVDHDSIVLIVHSLMGFDLSNYFAQIQLKTAAYVLCLESPDADISVLKHYQSYSIKNYRTFMSNAPPPFAGVTAPLRVTQILFTEVAVESKTEVLPLEKEREIIAQLKKRNPKITDGDAHQLLAQLSPSFVRSLAGDRLILAMDMFYRARARDNCQFEVKRNEDWRTKKELPSLQIVFAWRNVPKHNFLFRLAQLVYRHGLMMKRVTATYVDPYSRQNILIMSLGIDGSRGGAAWEEANLDDFLKELVTLKYFEGMEALDGAFVDTKLLTGNQCNLLKTITSFVHQVLVNADLNMYALNYVEEGLCRHPELTVQLVQAFDCKFNPERTNLAEYQRIKETFIGLVEHLDTGSELNDTRRKNILKQAIYFVDYTLKTNFYRKNKTALSFRLDPAYLDLVPYDRKERFPELPYAVFFMKGFCFIGFHIRFRDLSRGGLRTVFPERIEQMVVERNNVFTECYSLAYTQNKKNKDIPEGGAKGVIFLETYERLSSDETAYKRELEAAGVSHEEILEKLVLFKKEQRVEFLHQAQRSYIESFLTILNCEPDGRLRAKFIVDYWKKPEYVYLGPDENMHNEMIEWIAAYSKYYDYKPGGAFISSKPGAGINHKEFGVTSLGVNVFMEEILQFMGIDPKRDVFTLKMTGGPDGDVAGNEIYNLYRWYPTTAKLLTTIDVSGLIYDPEGLDLAAMTTLFKEGKPLRFYPPEKLHEGGFLLDTFTKREETAYAQQTLCTRKKEGKLVQDWLSGNEMNQLLRHHIHQVKADVFIPGGGRPRTLNENNIKDFFDETGKPTARVVVEGANLYLTPWARRTLEKAGVLVIKDSSANKGGVTCSSFEVLASLALSEEEFLKEKPQLVPEILDIIRERAREEARAMIKAHQQSGAYLTDLSEWVSERINLYKDQLIAYLQPLTLSNDLSDPLVRCLLNYCPPLLKNRYKNRILHEVPDVHKKAVIACHIASRLVYYRGLDWSPSLADVLPLIASDPMIVGNGVNHK